MGCSSSKKNIDEISKDAAGAYEAAEKGVVVNGAMGMGGADTSLTTDQREEQLALIFDACDDDKSGALSMEEYAQLFDKRVEAEMRKRWDLMDSINKDGALSKTEFVAYHMALFQKLDDDAFAILTGRLLTKGEDTVVMDEVAAKVESQDKEYAGLPNNM